MKKWPSGCNLTVVEITDLKTEKWKINIQLQWTLVFTQTCPVKKLKDEKAMGMWWVFPSAVWKCKMSVTVSECSENSCFMARNIRKMRCLCTDLVIIWHNHKLFRYWVFMLLHLKYFNCLVLIRTHITFHLICGIYYMPEFRTLEIKSLGNPWEFRPRENYLKLHTSVSPFIKWE